MHLCYDAISVNWLDGLGTSKNKLHPQNKMLGSDPFYLHCIFIFFILKGASAPSFYLGTPMGGMYVCMCVCMCVCVRMYVCACVCVYVCMYVCVYVCMYVCLYVCMSVCLYVCMSVCLYVCLYVCMDVCVYIYNAIQSFWSFIRLFSAPTSPFGSATTTRVKATITSSCDPLPKACPKTSPPKESPIV